MSRTRKLDPVEIRVLGALLEKEQTTPDQYPLTTAGVLAASNQKTNREPVSDLSETEVTEARAVEAPVSPGGWREERLERLESDVAELRDTVDALREQVSELRADLGVE